MASSIPGSGQNTQESTQRFIQLPENSSCSWKLLYRNDLLLLHVNHLQSHFWQPIRCQGGQCPPGHPTSSGYLWIRRPSVSSTDTVHRTSVQC